ncbi:DUF5667 domain-containing protein [Amycolatopsis antarctica]|uniref:DUF5667 domain-containing protein n=1 Tax=Amycolatopsis antarctica TaxID=1854586 RepID=UPI001056BE70|nr:DUF5667 domain-containing protein [Amycolatopsis antarctica]
MPSRFGRDAGERERFARAVDADAPADSALDAELAIVARLRRAGEDTPGPDRDARGRIAAGIARGMPTGDAPVSSSPTGRRDRVRGRRGHTFAPVLAAAACVVIAFGGVAVLLSEDTLPGDTLYEVKRARESASIELTFDAEGKAAKRLEYAALRVDELTELAGADGQPSAFGIALDGFDSDTRAGVGGLTAAAARTGSDRLDRLRSWTIAQSGRLAAIGPRMPAPVAERHAETLALLARVDERAAALTERMRCPQITSGAQDDLGPLPAVTECAEPPEAAISEVGTVPPETGASPDVAVPDPSPEVPAPEPPGEPEPPAEQQAAPPVVPAPTPPLQGTPPPQGPIVPAPVPDVLRPAPAPSRPPTSSRPPLIEIPPLLPGLPGIRLP